MYITSVPNRKSTPTILLRESYRENGKVKNRTIANLTSLPAETIEMLKRSLKGEKLASTNSAFEIIEDGSPAHGHVDAVMTAMKRLNFSKLIDPKKSIQRDLVLAMVVARILEPQSKLATTLWWKDTTLPEIFDIADADEDDLYDAMDWLLERQGNIEKRISSRHLEESGMALYDLTSSYFEGKTCPLAARGHNRDGKKGKLQVNYGLLTNRKGIPVAVSVFKGNTGDPKTVLPQIKKMKEEFSIEKFVLVGDRGMITQTQIKSFRKFTGIDWIGALRPGAIKKIVDSGAVQMELFDERNLFELEHPDFPDERLIACRNKELAERRKNNRNALIDATIKDLKNVKEMVLRKRLHSKEEITIRINRVLNRYKIRNYFSLDVYDDWFDYDFNENDLLEELTRKYKGDQKLIEKSLKRLDCHIEKITTELAKINIMTKQGQIHGSGAIGVRIGKIINKHKVAKFFKLEIADNNFEFMIKEEKVNAEASLDGIYFVRTSLPKGKMLADEAVRSYKQLSKVERAFRSFKTVDLMVRPIRHRLENRVKAHILLCMLAYYVQWHMMEAWRPLIFADEEQELKDSRDPVATAERSDSALNKIRTKQLDDGTPVYSFRGLLNHLGSIVRATCRCTDVGKGGKTETFQMDTKKNPKQQKAFDLLETIHL